MIISLYTVTFSSRVLTQKLTHRINPLRNITLNEITFVMTIKRYTVKTSMAWLLKYGLMHFM